jgi:hypothetical protein
MVEIPGITFGGGDLQESGEHPMTMQPAQSKTVLSNCPQCDAELAVLRVIPGNADCEYWTLRCTKCGGIHLDIINPAPRSATIHEFRRA